MANNILFSNDDVTIKRKPKPDFNYTSVPYSGKDVTNPFVDRDSYREGQDFYPDRLFRDEKSAQRQWFQNKDFQESGWGQDLKLIQQAIDEKKIPARNYGIAQDMMVKRLNDFQLKNTPRWNPKTKKYDGPMERPGGNYDSDPTDYFYLEGLDKARQNQFQKYDPFYGLSDEMIEDLYEEDMYDIRKKRAEDKGYGWERPEGNTEEFPYLISKYKDKERALGAGLLEGAGLFTDLSSNIIKNLYPYDETSLTGPTTPKGLIDTGMYQWKKSQFEKEVKKETGIDLAESWLSLPNEQKDALNADFKERSGYDYTPDLNPWYFEEAPTREFTDWAFYEPADDLRSKIFLEDWDTITLPWFDKFGGPIETSWTAPEIGDLATEFTAGWYTPSKILGGAQKLAASPLAKKLQKIPGVGNLLSKFTGPKSQTSGIIGLAAWLDALEGE
jgi:hypothetical protein